MVLVTRVSTRAQLLRRVGQGLLWLAVAVVVLRGIASIAGQDRAGEVPERPSVAVAAERFPAAEAQAFAAGFARAYLTFAPGRQEWVPLALEPYLSPALRDDAGLRVPDEGANQVVEQATVARVERLDDRHALITVAATVANETVTTRYLTVPVGRDARGALAVYDYPSFGPPPMRAELQEPAAEELPREEARDVEDVLERFFPVYFAGRGDEAELDYFLPPGRHLRTLEERYRFLRLESVSRPVGAGGGRVVLAAVEVQDAESRARHVLRYRVGLERRDRWYVRDLNAA
jgi:hypothetical protein